MSASMERKLRKEAHRCGAGVSNYDAEHPLPALRQLEQSLHGGEGLDGEEAAASRGAAATHLLPSRH